MQDFVLNLPFPWQVLLVPVVIGAVLYLRKNKGSSKKKKKGGVRIAYIDDWITEGNGPMDLVFVLALVRLVGAKLLFLGGTRSKGRPGVGNFGRQVADRAHFGSTPVYDGANTVGRLGESALSKAIIKHARQGKYALCVGGKYEDVGAALRAAPDIAKNLTIYLIGAGNENDNGTAAWDVIRKSGAKVIMFNRTETFSLIQYMKNRNPTGWLQKHLCSTNPGDLACQDHWLNENIANNGGQPDAGRVAQPFRGADSLTVYAALFGGKKAALKSSDVISDMEEGLSLLPRK